MRATIVTNVTEKARRMDGNRKIGDGGDGSRWTEGAVIPMSSERPIFIPACPEPVVLTGATGFLGGFLLAELLTAGRRVVVLGRGRNGETLAERLGRLLRWFGIEERLPLLEAVEADFEQPWCGLSATERSRLGVGGPMVHCAADTSFVEAKRAQVLKTNVGGLQNLLELADARATTCFHYVGTAYATGFRRETVPEEPVEPDRFTNAYEESKAAGERLTAEFCGSRGIPFTILRPSIVYGDSRSGRALRFNALYSIVHAFRYVSEWVRRDLVAGSGRMKRAGASIEADGTLSLPMRVVLPREGLINLVPVDYFARATLAVMAAPVSGRVYQVASPCAPSLGELVAYSARFLRWRGLRLACDREDAGEPLQLHEQLFAKLAAPYRCYLSDRRRFAIANTVAAAGGLEPPVLDYTIFERCMSFAESVGWGERDVTAEALAPSEAGGS